jgi:hypothetical protein
MPEPEEKQQSDKAEDEEKLRKSPECKRFEKLLKQVVCAPPMKESKVPGIEDEG